MIPAEANKIRQAMTLNSESAGTFPGCCEELVIKSPFGAASVASSSVPSTVAVFTIALLLPMRIREIFTVNEFDAKLSWALPTKLSAES
jgi:hypothetical protein